jgi:hypothetical protein
MFMETISRWNHLTFGEKIVVFQLQIIKINLLGGISWNSLMEQISQLRWIDGTGQCYLEASGNVWYVWCGFYG